MKCFRKNVFILLVDFVQQTPLAEIFHIWLVLSTLLSATGLFFHFSFPITVYFSFCLIFGLVFSTLLSATGWQALPALEAAAALGSGHKRNRYKKVAAPALHTATLPYTTTTPWNVARGRVAAHCPTVNNALGSLVSGGVATREAQSTLLAPPPGIWRKKCLGGNLLKIGKHSWLRTSWIVFKFFGQFGRMLICCSSLSC